MADIEHVADRVIVINHGTIIFDDKVQRMRRSLLATKLIEVRFEEPPAALVFDGVQVAAQSDTVYDLVVDRAACRCARCSTGSWTATRSPTSRW